MQGLNTAKLPPSRARARLALRHALSSVSDRGHHCRSNGAWRFWIGLSRADAWIVEDDYISEFRYEGSPLEGVAGARTAMAG